MRYVLVNSISTNNTGKGGNAFMDDKRPYDYDAVDELLKMYESSYESDTEVPKETEIKKTESKKKRTARKKNRLPHKQNAFFDVIKSIVKNKKIQFITALVLTIILLVGYPAYSWFKFQRSIERFEKISTPNSLYITAGRLEDSKNFEVDNVDVTAYWYDDSGTPDSRVTYQDYVFSVAGDYVSDYTLQFAHTTNNNYTYEIFRADVTNSKPSGILGKDYIEYTLTDKYDPATMEEIAQSHIYGSVTAGNKLYYKIKLADDGTTKVSLNGSGNTYQQADLSNVTASTYTVGGESVSYKGHYLNWASRFAAQGTGTYHNQTYGSTYTVGDDGTTDVQTHAEPLYWQANEIPVSGAVERAAFYHEYILRISWTNGTGSTDATATYKDTDMIYITVKAD